MFKPRNPQGLNALPPQRRTDAPLCAWRLPGTGGATWQQLHGGAGGEAGGVEVVEEVYLGNAPRWPARRAGAKNLDDANNYERGLHGAYGAVSGWVFSVSHC